MEEEIKKHFHCPYCENILSSFDVELVSESGEKERGRELYYCKICDKLFTWGRREEDENPNLLYDKTK